MCFDIEEMQSSVCCQFCGDSLREKKEEKKEGKKEGKKEEKKEDDWKGAGRVEIGRIISTRIEQK